MVGEAEADLIAVGKAGQSNGLTRPCVVIVGGVPKFVPFSLVADAVANAEFVGVVAPSFVDVPEREFRAAVLDQVEGGHDQVGHLVSCVVRNQGVVVAAVSAGFRKMIAHADAPSLGRVLACALNGPALGHGAALEALVENGFRLRAWHSPVGEVVTVAVARPQNGGFRRRDVARRHVEWHRAGFQGGEGDCFAPVESAATVGTSHLHLIRGFGCKPGECVGAFNLTDSNPFGERHTAQGNVVQAHAIAVVVGEAEADLVVAGKASQGNGLACPCLMILGGAPQFVPFALVADAVANGEFVNVAAPDAVDVPEGKFRAAVAAQVEGGHDQVGHLVSCVVRNQGVVVAAVSAGFRKMIAHADAPSLGRVLACALNGPALGHGAAFEAFVEEGFRCK